MRSTNTFTFGESVGQSAWLPRSGLPSGVLELANLYSAFARGLPVPPFEVAVYLHHLFDAFATSNREATRVSLSRFPVQAIAAPAVSRRARGI